MLRWPILLGVLLSTTFAAAQSTDTRSELERVRAAADEFDAGRRAFTVEDYSTAAEHFEKADRDAPAPEALRMAIRARLAANQPDRVATLAAAALSRYPNDEATVALAKEMLEKMPKRLHRITVQCNEPCSLMVDRRLVPGVAATESTVYVEPGQYEITAGWSAGRARSERIDALPENASTMVFQAPPLTTADPEPDPKLDSKPEPVLVSPPEPPSASPVVDQGSGLPSPVFYGALGLTTLFAGATIWSGLDMRANPGKEKVREDCAGKDESCPTYRDAISAQNRTNILMVGTGIAAAGTAVLGVFLTDWSSPGKSEAKATAGALVPAVGFRQGPFVQATGTF